MQRAVDRFGKLLIGGGGEEYVARLHRNFELMKVAVLQQLDMVERAFDQRLGTRLPIFLEQILLEAAGIDADADRAAIGLGRVDHFVDAVGRSDVARIDAQARRAGVRGFQRAFVVEMDVRDDRYLGGADDLLERGGAGDIGAGDADDVDARILAAADLVDRRLHVVGRGVGHGLDGDGRIAADGDVADHDLAALAAHDIAPGTHGHWGSSRVRRPIADRLRPRKPGLR